MGWPDLYSERRLGRNSSWTVMTIGALMRLPTVTARGRFLGHIGFMFLAFVGLNIADAWVTKQLLAHGGGEANPLAVYGSDMLFKGLAALAVGLVLLRFGKLRLLKVLNICMVAVVLWSGGWLLTYL